MAKQTLEQEYESIMGSPAYDKVEGYYTLGYVDWLEDTVQTLRKTKC